MSRYPHSTHKSPHFAGLSPMDQVPQVPRIYIGGLKALDNPDLLSAAKITHILTILEFDACDWPEFSAYHRLWIKIADDPGEKILPLFSAANDFIDAALKADGIVLVHCAMGISRSSAFLCAYLMYSKKIGVQAALETVREGRPFCIPNDGFMGQLEVYERMLKAGAEEDRERVFKEWECAWDGGPGI